jgi:lauroyl/myristoyl acyltransferase
LSRAQEPVGAARGDTWARRLLGRFHITGLFWLRAIMWVARGSEVRAVSMVWLWAGVFFCLLRRPRRIVTRHLDVLIGPCGFWGRQRRIYRFFREHAWCLVERFEQFRPDFKPKVELIGDQWPAAEGFIVCTAHVGMWEMGQLLPVVGGSRRMHVVREREEHPQVQRVVAELLAAHPHAHIVTHFLDDDAQLGATLLAALRRGDAVTLAGDRPKAGMVSLHATVFGHQTLFPAGPVALARAAGVVIVPTFVFRVGRRHYRAIARAPFRVARSDDRNADLQAAVDHLAREFEWAIRQDPYQWKRWEPMW